MDDTLWNLNKKICKKLHIPYDDIITTYSAYDILTSDAVYNFMLKQPWNQTEEAKKLISHKNVEFFDDFPEIIQRIQELIKE